MAEANAYIDEKFLQRNLSELKRKLSPRHVILYGSQDSGRSSDSDTVLVVSDKFQGEPSAPRIGLVKRALKRGNVQTVGLQCFTPEEFFEERRSENSVVAQACREGRWLAAESLTDAFKACVASDPDRNFLIRRCGQGRDSSDPDIVAGWQRFVHAIDQWYRRCPIEWQKGIMSSLLAKDKLEELHEDDRPEVPAAHALYQLFLYIYFSEVNGLWADIEPDRPSAPGRLDLRIGTERHPTLFYVEVVTRMERKKVREAQWWIYEIKKRLNELLTGVPEGFELSLSFRPIRLPKALEEAADENLPRNLFGLPKAREAEVLQSINEYASRIQTWVQQRERLPQEEYEFEFLELGMVVRAGYDPGVRLTAPPIRSWESFPPPYDPFGSILRPLNKKAKEHGDERVGEVPLVIAYGETGAMPEGEWFLQDALQGRKVMRAVVGPEGPSGEPWVDRRPNGLFTRADDSGQPLDSHVSGVLWMTLKPNWIEGVQLQYFPNRNAAHPLPIIPTPHGKRDVFWDCQDAPRWIPVEEML